MQAQSNNVGSRTAVASHLEYTRSNRSSALLKKEALTRFNCSGFFTVGPSLMAPIPHIAIYGYLEIKQGKSSCGRGLCCQHCFRVSLGDVHSSAVFGWEKSHVWTPVGSHGYKVSVVLYPLLNFIASTSIRSMVSLKSVAIAWLRVEILLHLEPARPLYHLFVYVQHTFD